MDTLHKGENDDNDDDNDDDDDNNNNNNNNNNYPACHSAPSSVFMLHSELKRRNRMKVRKM
jgi:hypothetical protein